MARVFNAPGKKRRGSVGGETYRFVNGISVVQEKSEGPTGPVTEGQMLSRSVMDSLIKIANAIKFTIDIGFKEMKKPSKKGKGKRSPYNAFISVNKNQSQIVFNDIFIDPPIFFPENLLVSKGSISPTRLSTATGDVSTQQINLTWLPFTYGKNQYNTDIPWAVLYNETTGLWVGAMVSQERYYGFGGIMPLGGIFPFSEDDVVRIYFFFQGQPSYGIGITGRSSVSTNMLVTIVP